MNPNRMTPEEFEEQRDRATRLMTSPDDVRWLQRSVAEIQGFEDQGALVNAVFFDVATRGWIESATWLMAKGADIESKDRSATALFSAATHRRTEMVQFLLDNGAALDAPGPDGQTPLLGAMCTPGNTEVVAALLKNGADPSAQDVFGDSPLMYAARANHSEEYFEKVADMLLRAGSDTQLRNNAGESARDVANKTRGVDISALIGAHEARCLEKSLRSTIPTPRDPMDRPAEVLGSLLDQPTPPRSTRRRL